MRLVWVLVVLALGIGLRSAQYFGRVDMWHDELAVARNVEDRGLVDLVSRPLDHAQVAPVGTLVLLETGTALLGPSEVGFRLGSWILGLASVLLFWRVATRFAEGAPLLAALAVFAVSPALIVYGASLKPYGGDVAVSLLLVLVSLRFLERPDETARGAVAGAVGLLACLVSFPAVPTAAILGVLIAVAWWRRSPRPPVGPLAALGTGWVLGAGLAAWAALGLVDPATDEFMREFWAEDFPPGWNPLVALPWALAKFHLTFAHSLIFFPPQGPVLHFIVGLPLALAVVGLLFVVRRPTPPPLLLLAPPVAGLGAAFLHLLPFDQRVGLHAAWPVLVLAALALTRLRGVLPGRWKVAATVLATAMALPFVALVLLAVRPPLTGVNGMPPRAVLTELEQRLQPADRLYVYTQGRHDMAWYGTRAGIEDWVQGGQHHGDPRAYLTEVDAFRGEPRVWFFWVRLDGEEPALIRSYLGALGRELERIPDDPASTGAVSAGAVLFDLSDPERSSRISPESFPLPAAAGQER